MVNSLSVHETEQAAIVAAKDEARAESMFSSVGKSVALTDDGDTLVFCARYGYLATTVRKAGWIKSGHVNVSKAIESMVY